MKLDEKKDKIPAWRRNRIDRIAIKFKNKVIQGEKEFSYFKRTS